jgi:drug/metabolite transporter (DMT)-like permease
MHRCTCCAGGVALITHPPFGGGHAWNTNRLIGVAAGLGSSVFAAGAFLSIKSLGNSEQAIVMSMWFHSVSAAVAIVPLCFSIPAPAVLPTLKETCLLVNVVWTSFIGQLLISRGFQLLAPSSAAAINLTQVMHARVLSTLVLHDPFHWFSFAGSALIVLGVLLSQLGKPRKVTKEGNAQELASLAVEDDEITLLHSEDLCADCATGIQHQPSIPDIQGRLGMHQ